MRGLYASLGVASINQTVGDWRGNQARIEAVIAAAKQRQVKLLLLPEMCISGYTLGDRLLRRGTAERSWKSLMALRPATAGLAVAVGLPLLHQGVLFNAMALLADGELVGLVAKENLATGDVEYENRYFQAWPHGQMRTYHAPEGDFPLGTQLFELPGLGTIGFEICEDAWKGIRPGSTLALAGADILLNPSASWFTIGKHQTRRRLVQQASLEDHCVYLYASLSGCDATRLVFDGSTFIGYDGSILDEGPRFVFEADWTLVDRVVDLEEARHHRMEEGSWRDQHERLEIAAFGPLPPCTQVAGDYSTQLLPQAPAPYWEPTPAQSIDPSLEHLFDGPLKGRPFRHTDLNHLELELALAIALRDYSRKTGVDKFTLALSGGRDSAMVALLIHRMLRYDNPQASPEALAEITQKRFTCAYLATENSSTQTREAARQVALDIGAKFLDGVVQAPLDAATQCVEGMIGEKLSWENPQHDIPLQNIQARLRGMLIWTIANLERALLLVTSNKSEAAVGYTTMDGDSSGGLAPIADVPKSLVSMWLSWAESYHGCYPGVSRIMAMQASAELRPPGEEQTDEDDLMPFYVLDQFMYAFVQLGLEPVDILRRLWPALGPRYYQGDLRRFAADLRTFVRLFCFAQWKRERFAISFRVTAFDLDPKTGFRFPPVQAPSPKSSKKWTAMSPPKCRRPLAEIGVHAKSVKKSCTCQRALLLFGAPSLAPVRGAHSTPPAM